MVFKSPVMTMVSICSKMTLRVNELGQCLVFSESQTGASRQVARIRQESGGSFQEMTLLDICDQILVCSSQTDLPYLVLCSYLTPVLKLNIPSR